MKRIQPHGSIGVGKMLELGALRLPATVAGTGEDYVDNTRL
jgi:hypothetical protein